MKAVYNKRGVRVPGMYEMGGATTELEGATTCEINDTTSGTDIFNYKPKRPKKCRNSGKGSRGYMSQKKRARLARRG